MGSHNLAVLVITPAGLKIAMTLKVVFAVLLLFGCPYGVRKLRRQENRDQRSLVNTFPFNSNADHAHQQHHEDHAPQSLQSLDSRAARQGQEGESVSFADVAAAGKKCIDKVEQEEECEENFQKNCFIEYEQIAFNETVEICRTPLVKDCDKKGPEICRTEYESECWTKQEEHLVKDDVVECKTVVEEKCEDETSGYTTNTKCSKWPKEVCSVSQKKVKKYTPITGCTKEPRELCAPAGCGFKQGKEECYDKTQTVVQDAPKEECNLEPQRTCKYVTKLVPKLTPTEECTDVPKEVCTRSRTNPRKIKKPVVKKWCYIPSEESGLA